MGLHYNGTTSLEKYLLARNFDVSRDEGLFSLGNGSAKFNKYKDSIPIIIFSPGKIPPEKFREMLKPWLKWNPLIFDLDDMARNPNFPHELGRRHE